PMGAAPAREEVGETEPSATAGALPGDGGITTFAPQTAPRGEQDGRQNEADDDGGVHPAEPESCPVPCEHRSGPSGCPASTGLIGASPAARTRCRHARRGPTEPSS